MSEELEWTTRGLDYEPPEIDTTTAHSARLYDYLLGGKDNYPPDREAAERLLKVMPSALVSAQQNRRFMRRLVRYLAAEEGIAQFLDIGAGIPTSPNVHEVAQEINPAARVVYVDNDPIVLAHAHARLTSAPQGLVAYIHADLRDTDAVMAAPDLTATLDLSRPVALTILSTLHFITDDDQAYGLVRSYLRQLPAGSFLALSLATDGIIPEGDAPVVSALGAHGIAARSRSRTEVTAFFDGLELIEPGVVPVHQWRPDADAAGVRDSDVTLYCGVARKA
jgi:S-adenosyl methyltransferase